MLKIQQLPLVNDKNFSLNIEVLQKSNSYTLFLVITRPSKIEKPSTHTQKSKRKKANL